MMEEFIPFFQKEKRGWKNALGHIYVTLAVMIGFVFFRADTIGQGVAWIGKMFTGFQTNLAAARLARSQLTPVHISAFAAGVFASLPVMERIGKDERARKAFDLASFAASLALFFVCMLNLAGGTYNPFIYFRF